MCDCTGQGGMPLSLAAGVAWRRKALLGGGVVGICGPPAVLAAAVSLSSFDPLGILLLC